MVTSRFASIPDPAAVASLESVTDVDTRNGGDTLVLTVEGTVDAVLKRAAEEEVLSISSRSSELEDVFLSYYARTDAS